MWAPLPSWGQLKASIWDEIRLGFRVGSLSELSSLPPLPLLLSKLLASEIPEHQSL
jgi:hypothetical protein